MSGVLRSRRVLEDCKATYDLLEVEPDEKKFQILWVAGIALARVVGDVLDKVDGKQDERYRQAISAEYKRWKSDREANKIYWDFIRDERNRVLKEYEFGFLSGDIPILAAGELFVLDENLYCPISDGKFAGEDCRDVLKQAIGWWEEKLAGIEKECAKDTN